MNAHRILAQTCWSAAIAVAVRGVDGSLRTAASLRWLNAPGQDDGAVCQRRHLVIVVPMLREQRLIEATTRYLTLLAQRWGPAVVVLTTTEREYVERRQAADRLVELARALRHRRSGAWLVAHYGGVLTVDGLSRLADASGNRNVDYPNLVRILFDALPSTPELAAKLAADHERVVHHHVLDPSATMVHQINAAVSAEMNRLTQIGVPPDKVWFAVYNADSRPSPDTLEALARMPADSRLVQQSTLFSLGLGRPGWRSGICDGAALLQTRWSLAREIPRLRAQAEHARRTNTRRLRLGHCVGHGLFVRGDAWLQLGGLPTTTMNEDLAFGYLASAARIPIDPLPALEFAEAPQTPRTVIRQARQWFWSYPQYPAAAALAAQQRAGTRTARTGLTLSGMVRGGLWLGQSPAVAATLMLPLLSRHRTAALALSATALTSYLGAPMLLLTIDRHRNDHPHQVLMRHLPGILAAALISSLGPWWCVVDLARAHLSGGQPEHDKTER